MLKLLVFLALCVVAAAATKWHELEGYTFEAYKKEFSKHYESSSEEGYRKAVFERRLAEIKAHNKDETKTWKNGVNALTDRSPPELKQLRGYKKGVQVAMKPQPFTAPPAPLPTSVDWRTKGVVTPVKNQAQCGSCWSFAAAETLESQFAIKKNKLLVLSEQNILDCTPNPQQCGGTGGCEGGTAELVYTHFNGTGLSLESDYPYKSGGGQDYKCKSPLPPVAATVSGFVKLPTNQYLPLMQAVATIGPIAISVDASSWSMYESGVFQGCSVANPDIDHAVQLVGYGTDPKTKLNYWLVRNSWASNWGEAGYIRLVRTANEQTNCGVDKTPADGDGCKGGPKTENVCGTCGILYDTCYPTV